MKLSLVLLVTGAIGLAASVGALQSDGRAEPDLRTSYYANGQLQSETGIVEGRRDGIHRRWSAEGTLLEEGQFKEGEKDGEWTFRLADGSLDPERSGLYRAGVRIAELDRD